MITWSNSREACVPLNLMVIVGVLILLGACSEATSGNGTNATVDASGTTADGWRMGTEDGASSARTVSDVDTEMPGETVSADAEGDAHSPEVTEADTAVVTDAETAIGDSADMTADAAMTDDGSEQSGEDAGQDISANTDADASVEEDVDEGPETVVESEMTISTDPIYQNGELYGMAVNEAGSVSIFWRGEGGPGDHALLVSQSDDVVSVFENPSLLKQIEPLGITSGGDISIDDDHHLLTWRDTEPVSSNEQILFRRAQMPELVGEDFILSESSASSSLYRPHFAWRSTTSHCVLWQHGSDVKMRCTLDGGLTWADEVQVDPAGVSATVSDAAFANTGDLVVAYQEDGDSIVIRRTADFGVTWTEPYEISAQAGEGSHVSPSLVAGPDTVLYLGWHTPQSGMTSQAWMTWSPDGETWQEPFVLPTIQSVLRFRPGRAGEVHAIGQDAKFGYALIDNDPDTLGTRYMSSDTAGQSWGTAGVVPITEGAMSLGNEMVANLQKGLLHIAWWETLPGQMTSQQLMFITVEPNLD